MIYLNKNYKFRGIYYIYSNNTTTKNICVVYLDIGTYHLQKMNISGNTGISMHCEKWPGQGVRFYKYKYTSIIYRYYLNIIESS